MELLVEIGVSVDIGLGDLATVEILDNGDFDVFGDRRDRSTEEENGSEEDVVETNGPVFEDKFAVEIRNEEGNAKNGGNTGNTQDGSNDGTSGQLVETQSWGTP